jgi:hypothetical protein
MSQIRPKSFFEKADWMVMGTGISEKIYKKYLRMIETLQEKCVLASTQNGR